MKLDCLKFAEQIQYLAASQESDVLHAFMCLQSPYLPRDEFDQNKNYLLIEILAMLLYEIKQKLFETPLSCGHRG